MKVIFDVDNGWIFQMLLFTDGGLRSIGVGRCEQLPQRGIFLRTVACHRDVFLFVHGFKLGVESANDHVLEAVGLYACPIIDFIRGNVLYIAGNVVARVGVGTFRSDTRHELVVLVGYVILRGQLRDGIDLVIGGSALNGVGQRAILLVTAFDFVQVGFLLSVIGGAKLLRAFKHEVFEIVSQARGLCRVVTRPGAHNNVGLQAWALLVDTHVDL